MAKEILKEKAKAPAAAAAPAAAELPLYKKPGPLDRDAHKNWRVQPTKRPFDFARRVHCVVLAGVEFAPASRHYPIVFANDPQGRKTPIALLGLRQQQNLFVNEKGEWTADYVPAYIRRYPFVLAEGAQQHTVCIDLAYEGFNTKNGEPLFKADGEPAALLANTLGFVKQYHADFLRTQAFVKQLEDKGLLLEMAADARWTGGERLMLKGFWVVDEKKLYGLDDATLAGFCRQGAMAWIMGHLFSLGNLQRLVQLAGPQAEAA